jgi:hypothetical protein
MPAEARGGFFRRAISAVQRAADVRQCVGMPPRTDKPGPVVHYWQRRVRSPAFKRDLTAVVRRELTALAGQRVRDVVDAEVIRSLIREWDTRMIDRSQLAELVVEAIRPARRKRRGEGPRRALGAQLIADFDAFIREGFALSADAEDAIATIMRQDFVRGLFTDIIYSAIVSFNERVNPLFGALTMRALEDQIRGFIRLFMPMLQRQATAFIVNEANRRVAMEFVSAIVRQLLERPLPPYLETMTAGRRHKLEVLVRHALANADLQAVVREAALAAWEDLYGLVADRRLGDLLRLEEQAGWFAERCVEFIVPALSRSHILEFVAAEAAVAGTAGLKPIPRR